MRAAADVVRAAPVEELPARAAPTRAPRRPCGSAAPTRRARARRGSASEVHAAVADVEREDVEVAFDAPASRRAGRSGRRAARSAARRGSECTAASPSGWSVRCITRSTPSSASSVRTTRGISDARGRRGRGRRPAPRASSGRARSPPSPPLRLAHAARRQHAEPVERPEQVDLVLDLRLRVVRADDHRVVLEERVRAAGGVHQPLDLLVGGGERGDLRRPGRACASACRCRAATAAGSRTGRARPGTAPTQPACWSRTPGSPSCERQPVLRDAKMSA